MAKQTRGLVVDDEPNIAYLVAASLRFDGIDSVTAASGEAALSALKRERFDFVILDVMLPDFDGFEVLRRMRAAGDNTPVLFLTARDETPDRVRGLTVGGDDYVTKPFAVEELVARVNLILRRAGAVDVRVLEVGDLRIDDDAHRVFKGGNEVHLSPTEYKLLRYLMVNVDRVVSRSQILDHVWDYDFDGESSIIESFMSYLRKRVDSTEPKLIHTLRGIGYSLRTPT